MHRRTLQQREDKRHQQAEWKRREDLIKQAKEAYKNKLAAQAQTSKANVGELQTFATRHRSQIGAETTVTGGDGLKEIRPVPIAAKGT